jgi:KDO2-lipid IV(A) lauroyltransferase
MGARLERWSLAPDGRPRPDAPFGRGPLAAHVLGHVIDVAAAAGSRLPAPVAHALAVAGGHAEWAVRPAKRRTLRANLAHALGDSSGSRALRRTVRREVVNEAKRSADLLWAIGRPSAFHDGVEVVGAEHARAIASAGRGMVAAGVHLGGWELAAGLAARVLEVPTTVIVADDWLAWSMQHVRGRGGMRTVSPVAPLGAARGLTRGEAVIVLGDDARASTRRHVVRFCDAAAALPAGPVALAQLTGAALLPFSVVPTAPRRWRITLEPAIEPPHRDDGEGGATRVLQQLADRWSGLITRHPEHWAAVFPIEWHPTP